MKRLVYSPKIGVYIRVDRGKDGHDIVDLSPYVVSCSVNRKLDQVSRATVSFRNPKDPKTGRFIFTERDFVALDGSRSTEPMFHPMDPIIITMTRLKDKPIQVFTGYCDTTPYFQMRPGVATIEASCTLKRLLYTYWDPALPFVQEFLQSKGFNVIPGYTIHNFEAESQTLGDTNKTLTDSGLGSLLFSVLEEVGGWDSSTIFIEQLPPNILQVVSGLFEKYQKESEESRDEFFQMLKNILTTDSPGGSGGGGDTGDVDLDVVPADLEDFPRDKDYYTKTDILALTKGRGFKDPVYAAKVSWCESAGGKRDAHSGLDALCCWGLWQINCNVHPLTPEQACDPIISTNYAYKLSKGGTDWGPWDCANCKVGITLDKDDPNNWNKVPC
jgi:hypothetical protein